MTPTEAAADIIATYAATPKHLTGPPVVNWASLVDGDPTDAQLMGVLAAHPARPLDVVRAHNTRARKMRSDAIRALAERFQVAPNTIRRQFRQSSLTGSPVPTWPEAWETVAEQLGRGVWLTYVPVRKALEALGRTNIAYHMDSEGYPSWVQVRKVPRGQCQVRKQIMFLEAAP